MSVDYVRLLEELGIDTDPKRETARRIYTHCVFCGDDDPSAHLGLMKDGSAWGCARREDHRGRSPFRLIRALSGWNYDQIAAYLGGQVTPDSIEKLEKSFAELDQPLEVSRFSPVDFPPEAHVFTGSRMEERFKEYLRVDRRFGTHVDGVIKRYGLRWCMSGRFEWRILIPVIDRGRMYGFTARSIGKTQLRYLAEPPGEQIKNAVYNGDNCKGGLVLVVCEGPMDAKKIDYFGRRYGVSALAIMSTTVTPEQEVRIVEIARRYQQVVILLDASALADAMALQGHLRSLDPSLGQLPPGRKDPGDLYPKEARQLAQEMLMELSLW